MLRRGGEWVFTTCGNDYSVLLLPFVGLLGADFTTGILFSGRHKQMERFVSRYVGPQDGLWPVGSH